GGAGLELSAQFVESRAASLLVGCIAALESGALMAAIERCARLRVDRIAELALDGVRNERGDLGRKQRHADDGHEKERGGGRNGPENHLAAQTALNALGAIDRS